MRRLSQLPHDASSCFLSSSANIAKAEMHKKQALWIAQYIVRLHKQFAWWASEYWWPVWVSAGQAHCSDYQEDGWKELSFLWSRVILSMAVCQQCVRALLRQRQTNCSIICFLQAIFMFRSSGKERRGLCQDVICIWSSSVLHPTL